MDDDGIVTAFVVLDTPRAALGHRDDVRAGASDAAVLPVAVVAAKYCPGHLARALALLRLGRSRSGPRSVSRCRRRLHALRAWLGVVLATLGALFAQGQVVRIDSRPVPVCRRARARRCRTVRGRDCCGCCAATGAPCFGWRRHLIGPTGGVPVACALVPGGRHDRTPIHALPDGRPAAAPGYGDKGANAAAAEATILADSAVRLVPIRTATMRPNSWAEKLARRE